MSAAGSPGNTVFFNLDLSNPDQCPAFRAALGLGKKNRKVKSFMIDPEMEAILQEHAGPNQQSDLINMGINLVALMNGWIGGARS